jgi:hypothetical protein
MYPDQRPSGQGGPEGGGDRGRGGGKAVYAAIMEHTVMNVSMYVYLMMSVVTRSEPLAEYDQAERVRSGFLPASSFQPACKRLQAQALSFSRCS